MGDIRVFYDTEFTTPGRDGDLISIGCVTENYTNADGRRAHDRLYIEILDYDRSSMSSFVEQTVLPLLSLHNPERLTRDQAAVRVTQWLSDVRGGDLSLEVIMLSDSNFDWQHLLDLNVPMPGETPWARQQNIVGRLIQQELTSGRQQSAFNEELELYWKRRRFLQASLPCGGQHNALEDALAIKAAFKEAHFG